MDDFSYVTFCLAFGLFCLWHPYAIWLVGSCKRSRFWIVANKSPHFTRINLPANAAIIEDPDLTPSNEPITLSPEQAVSAAVVLQANRLIPIHYGAFHHPPGYVQTPHVMSRLITSAEQRGVQLHLLQAGDKFQLAEPTKAYPSI